MKYFIAILIAFIFSGCIASKSPVVEYMIDAKMAHKDIVDGCNSKSIKVLKSFAPSKLQTLNMNYTQGNSKVFSYSQSMWAESPSDAITLEVVKLLRDKRLFKTVNVSKSRAKTDLILETNIEKFIQYFDKDLKTSFVEVSLTFTVIDVKTNKVIASKNFKTKEMVSTLDAMGGVKALNIALGRVLLNSIDYFKEVCR